MDNLHERKKKSTLVLFTKYGMLKESQVGVIARIYQTPCSSYPKPQPVWHLLPIKLTSSSRYGKLVSKNLLMREWLGPPGKNQLQG